jgi:hypothetical protein
VNRRIREGALDHKNYRVVKKQLLHDVQAAVILQITPSVISLSIRLLENNVWRTMDALHAVCALEWKADLFAASDKRQLIAPQNADELVKSRISDGFVKSSRSRLANPEE